VSGRVSPKDQTNWSDFAVDEDDQDDGRPDDCMCSEVSQRLGTPCFPCYRDGFETPAEVSD